MYKKNVTFRRIAAFICIAAMLLLLASCGKAQEEEISLSEPVDERAELLRTDAAHGLFILVNKENPVEADYCADDLSPIYYYTEDRGAEWRFMRAEAADHFNAMVEAAAADGVDFAMTTAYRSYDYQSILWRDAVHEYRNEESANFYVARPGQSEHQTGLAVDISSAENNFQLNEHFKDTVAGQWVREHAPEYGFIIRYPSDGSDITGYGYEPWHLRYVGQIAAMEITAQGQVLEEYIYQLQTEGILD